MFDSDQMTLACISTGGPATTVTWTRDSITVTEGTETVLDNPVTAQYTHTLNVTTGGEYTCTVSNNKPSSDSATITVPGILPYEFTSWLFELHILIKHSKPRSAIFPNSYFGACTLVSWFLRVMTKKANLCGDSCDNW